MSKNILEIIQSKSISDLYNGSEVTDINNNMEKIIKSSNIVYLIQHGILKKLKHIAPEKFRECHSIVFAQLFKPSLTFSDPLLLEALTIIAEEIAENEKTDMSEIEYIDRGGYSTVAKLGNKVIKIGHKRLTYEIPYHRRLLQPLIRRKILPQKSNPYHDEDLIIEIQEYIKPDKSITDDDVYLVYKELREDGIIWVDAKKENLGRLEKENIIHYSEPLYVDDESLGFIPETIKKRKPLQKGDLVIIDTDHLYRENDPRINPISIFNQNPYEKRYQEEKNKKTLSER